MKKVIIYTDGGCRPNPGVGAWAAVLRSGDHVRELCGGDLETTNNRMELTAALRALEALKEPCAVEMYTDSQYVKKGLTEWMKNWKKNHFQRRDGGKWKPVLNAELWKALDAEAARHEIDWRWVRGHVGVADNERCDELCSAKIDELSRRR